MRNTKILKSSNQPKATLDPALPSKNMPRYLFRVREPCVAGHGEKEVLRHGRRFRLRVEGLVDHVYLCIARDGRVVQVCFKVGVVVHDLVWWRRKGRGEGDELAFQEPCACRVHRILLGFDLHTYAIAGVK